MTMFTCAECGGKKTKGYVRACNKCGRILCDTCKDPVSACKSSKNGKADCRGMFLRPFVPQM